jgi:hypothetical protein
MLKASQPLTATKFQLDSARAGPFPKDGSTSERTRTHAGGTCIGKPNYSIDCPLK